MGVQNQAAREANEQQRKLLGILCTTLFRTPFPTQLII